jgi:hypothetical protein
MPEIKIKGIPQELLDNIDSLVRLSDYSDRSAFLIAVLSDYCLYHDNYFMHCLPDTIRILAEDAMKREEKQHEKLLQCAVKSINESNRINRQLIDAMDGENYENNSDD